MKTNFKYLTLVIAALLIGFSSCSKDDVTKGGTENDAKSVFLKISNAPVTYAAGAHQANGSLSFSSGHLYFTDDAGTILRYHSVGDKDAGADFNMSELSSGSGKEITELPSTVAAVYVVGNTQDLPNKTNISAVKAHMLNVASQVQVTAGNIVNLYGENTKLTQVGETNSYNATVNIAPTVARIELFDITATGGVTSFKVAGIFVDNYYATASVDGTISSALVYNGADALKFSDNSTSYPKSLTPSIYDWYSKRLASDEKVVKLKDDAVWGYNLFAKTNGENDVPRIVIILNDIVTSGGASFANPQFITIKGFNNGDDALKTIEPGNVYTIASAGFSFDQTNLTPDPNMETKAVSVNVTVSSWVNVPITPSM